MRSLLRGSFFAAAAATSLRDTLAGRADLDTFRALIDQFELWQVFEGSARNITVMVPNDAAYDRLLEIGLDLSAQPAEFTVPILKYHLLQNEVRSPRIPEENEAMLVESALMTPNMTQPFPVKLFRQNSELYAEGGLQLAAKVVEPDLKFEGGLVHILDASLVAPHNISITAGMNGFSEFLQFMADVDLVSEFESLRDATLFIPNNEAWQESKSVLSTMSLVEKRTLLRNHAASGRVVYRQELSRGQSLTMAGGRDLAVRVDEQGTIRVGNAAIARADLLWYNGVAHVVDQVIMDQQDVRHEYVVGIDQGHQQYLAVPFAA